MFKKLSSKTLISLFIFSIVLSMSIFASPKTIEAQVPGTVEAAAFLAGQAGAGVAGIDVPSFWLEKVFQPAFAYIATTVLKIVSLFTGMGAMLLNATIYYTIVKVAENYENIAAINIAWGTVRDLANMSFIFILLYAAIKTILGMGSNTQSLIVKVVVVAILINFSLFFTKIVIDISNVLALLFYENIAGTAAVNATGTTNFAQMGLSNAFMDRLQLTSLMMPTDANTPLGIGSIITVGAMGSIMLLIATFIFFAVAILLLIRYVVLILVLILSPLAFLGFILPEIGKYKDQWLSTLTGQAFFAPIYFVLTWITLTVLDGVMATVNNNLPTGGPGGAPSYARAAVDAQGAFSDPGVIAMFINFAIVIIFLIASIVIAKQWADKAGGGVSKATGWAMGKAGGATLGVAGGFGRNVIGSRAAAMATDENLKDRASRGGFGGGLARLQLATARKGATSSFDLRGSALGSSLDAGKAKKGGFIQDQKDRAKNYEARYKPDSGKIKAAEADERIARQKLANAKTEASRRANAEIAQHPELKNASRELEEARTRASEPSRLVGVSQDVLEAEQSRKDAAVKMAEKRVQEEEAAHQEAKRSFVTTETTVERQSYRSAQAKRAELKVRMERMAKRTESGWMSKVRVPGFMASGKVKAAAIRSAAKSKSAKDSFLEASKKMADEESGPKEEKPESTPDSENKSKE